MLISHLHKALFVVCHTMQTFSNDRQDRIKYLRKEMDRKKRLPELLNSLSLVAGRTLTEADALTVEQSDDVWTKIQSNEKLQQANLSIAFPFRDKDKFVIVLQALRSSLNGQVQYFTTSRFYESCLLLIDTSFCIDHFEQIIKFDGDTFYIYDQGLNNGLWVDTNEEHWSDKAEYLWTYELRVRGADWMDKVYEAYRKVI